MKVFKTVFSVTCLAVFIGLAAVFGGCFDSSPQEVYYIGGEYNFGNILIKVEDDKQNERFVYNCKITTQDKYSHYFSFDFTNYDTLEEFRNSAEFSYTDSTGAEVVFNADGYYIFNSTREIYISYAGANERIKESITNNRYDIVFAVGTFIYDPRFYN